MIMCWECDFKELIVFKLFIEPMMLMWSISTTLAPLRVKNGIKTYKLKIMLEKKKLISQFTAGGTCSIWTQPPFENEDPLPLLWNGYSSNN